MIYAIGLTGTIASGKSTAADFFRKQSITVLCADAVAQELTQKDKPALQKIVAHFGQTILTETSELDRRALRKIIAEHPEERKWLEGYLHPQIRQIIEERIKNVKTPYVVIDIPLLTNREDFPYLNRVLLLEIDETYQLERLMKRDKCTKEEAIQMIKLQPDKIIRRGLADDIIQNNGNITHLHQILETLHKRYLLESD